MDSAGIFKSVHQKKRTGHRTLVGAGTACLAGKSRVRRTEMELPLHIGCSSQNCQQEVWHPYSFSQKPPKGVGRW